MNRNEEHLRKLMQLDSEEARNSKAEAAVRNNLYNRGFMAGFIKGTNEAFNQYELFRNKFTEKILSDILSEIDECVDAGEAMKEFEDGVNTAKKQCKGIIQEHIDILVRYNALSEAKVAVVKE